MGSSTSTTDIQSSFLGQIRNKIGDSISFADELAELLNVSRDSAYRRIRGETVLSLDEVKKLYDQYGLSIDAIMSPNSNMVSINHKTIDFHYSVKEWLNSLIQNLELAKSSKDLELIFACKDLPVFNYFRFPEMAAFKLFVWSKSIIQDPQYEHSIYSPDIMPREIMADAARAWSLYSSVASTEIWSDEVVNSTIKQIEFYYECGFFSHRNQVTGLYDCILEIIKLSRAEASEGKKSEGGSFELYQNEILIPDNTIYARIQGQQVVFINYNTMDTLTTHQKSFCAKTKVYVTNLIKNSALISATAEKERNRFFNKLEEKITTSINRLP